MRAAFATWNQRIAPVFDVARQVHIVVATSGQISDEVPEMLTDEHPTQRALQLTELGIDTLVCGAISQQMRALVEAYGIEVIPFVAGDLQEVIRAWLSGLIQTDAYAMPGCGRGGGRGRKGRGSGGGGRRRRGRPNGPSEARAADTCVCPQCGYQEPRAAGIRCRDRECPRCGEDLRLS